MLPADAPPHLAPAQPVTTAGTAADTGAPLPPPPLVVPTQSAKPLPPPPSAATADQALGAAAAAAPAHDDDVNMDLEEGQLADSPVAPPPLPPPATPDTALPQPPSAPAAPAPGARAMRLGVAVDRLQVRVSKQVVAFINRSAARTSWEKCWLSVVKPSNLVRADPAVLRPGGMLCRAAATLWLGRVPRLVGEASLRKECAKAGGVERVVFPVREEALVTFAGMRCDALPPRRRSLHKLVVRMCG